MINGEHLREFRPVYRYKDGANITLSIILEELNSAAIRYGIPVAIKYDQVKSGGMFNKKVEDCLVLYHPEHPKDYYNVCIRVQRQGNIAFVAVNDFGNSKNEVKAGSAAGAIKGGNLGVVGSAITNAIFGPKKSKVEAEHNYYASLIDLFDEVIS